MKMQFWCYLALVGMYALSYAAVAAIVSLFSTDPAVITWSNRIVGMISTFALYLHFQCIAEQEYMDDLSREIDI